MDKKKLILCFFSILTITLIAQNGGELCSNATIISALPYVAIGNTEGSIDDYFASCPDYPNQGGAGDVVYVYTTGNTEMYVDFNLCVNITDFDTQLYIYEGSCTGDPVGCQEDGCQSPDYGAPYNSQVLAQLLSLNTTYYIIIDGFGDNSHGNYQLNVSETIGLGAPAATNLPLILIDTQDQNIVDEPKITANMKIIHNGPDELNSPIDSANVYNGFVGIEIRGQYSSTLPQKPFGFETRDEFGENNNVSLLDMPTENDWILLANYNDKTFFRNVLAFDLFAKMGHYAPRTQLCEVVINDVYQGIYVLTEKIKKDNDRIDIATLDADDNAGDSLTGGYIFRVDYWNGSNSWESDYENPNYSGDGVHYVYNYPKPENLSTQQADYIQSKVQAFEDALWGDDFLDLENGYRTYIDVPSFIDYLIVNEFARNVDGFKKSRNFHKDKDSKDPLIYAGPVWDFDWAYKDTDNNMLNGSGWRHSFSGGTDVVPPGWYVRMMQDSTFRDQLACRYFNLREDFLSNEAVFQFIDSMATTVESAQERHYIRWPTLGFNVGTPEIGDQPDSYEGEIIKFKNWIEERLAWLDLNMPGECLNVGIQESVNNQPYTVVYPNPSAGLTNFYCAETMELINVYSEDGRLVQSLEGNGGNLISHDLQITKGSYVIVIETTSGRIITKNLIH